MKMKILLITLLTTTFFFSKQHVADADETDGTTNQCVTECKAGKNKVGFSDGDHVSCSCFDTGSSMVETVVNQTAEEPLAEDGEPLDDQNTDNVAGVLSIDLVPSSIISSN